MSSKLSPLPILRDHVDTLRSNTTDKLRYRDLTVFYGLPTAAAAFAAVRGFHAPDVGAFLGGVSVFAALLFGLVVFVFQLRLSATADPRIGAGSRVVKLIDQLFKNVNYAVLIGLLTTTCGVLAVWLHSPVWVSAILVWSVIHLMLTVLMCIKRVDAAYRQMTRM